MPNVEVNDLRRIPSPTLLMAGSKRNIPYAEWFILNDADLVIQHTHPEIVGPRILDFLARHDDPAPTTAR